jgi:LytS/YehU family sensor histidine kinase
VEPQFLFDTLAHVETLYESDADAAERMLDDLIVFLRKALPSLNETASTVEAEFALARAWLGITKIRLGGILQFAIVTPEDAAGVRMPPMILLPLLERAVEPMTRMGLPKLVEISARVADDRVRVSVGETHATAGDRRRETLSQLRERLQSLYGPRASIDTQDNDTMLWTTMEIPHERTNGDHR